MLDPRGLDHTRRRLICLLDRQTGRRTRDARPCLGIDSDWASAPARHPGWVRTLGIPTGSHYGLGVFFVLSHLATGGARVLMLCTKPRRASERGLAMGGGRPSERRFTVGGSGKSVARCHRTVFAYWKFESISLQQRVGRTFGS